MDQNLSLCLFDILVHTGVSVFFKMYFHTNTFTYICNCVIVINLMNCVVLCCVMIIFIVEDVPGCVQREF